MDTCGSEYGSVREFCEKIKEESVTILSIMRSWKAHKVTREGCKTLILILC
jgi:hypothetical protein